MNIVGGIIGVIIGFVVIKYTFQLVNTFGQVGWAEQNMGSGGTYTLYKITGVVIIFLSLLYMFGGIGFLLKPFTSIFGGLK